MPTDLHWQPVLAAIVYAALGLAVFLAAFVIADRLTPYQLWKELVDEHNVALAIVVGALAISMALIVSSAIR